MERFREVGVAQGGIDWSGLGEHINADYHDVTQEEKECFMYEAESCTDGSPNIETLM